MKFLIVGVFTLLLINSCSFQTKCLYKEGFLSGYQKFISDLQTHYVELSEGDWVSVDEEFKIYLDRCYPRFKSSLDISEKMDFWKKTLTYNVLRKSSDSSYKINSDIDIEAELKEFSEQARLEIEDYIKTEINPNLEKAIDDVLTELESFGDKIKKWLNE